MSYISEQLNHTLDEFESDNLGEHYKGKVREIFSQGDKILMITSDRVSAFDCVLGTIPFKGQILSEIANFWFDKTKDLVPNHIIDTPDPQVLVAKRAKTLPVEVIVRQYITGSLWREYSSGINGQYGFMLPEGLKKDQKFDEPLLTPSTKADYGLHDEPISREAIVNGLVEESVYAKAEEYALALFKAGQEWAAKQGLILVDTKYEFGIVDGELIVIDEIHTPDSSRYWVAKEYETRFNNGESQLMLDKENIRQWLIEKGFSGEGIPPELSEEIRTTLAERYVELYRTLTGRQFDPEVGDVKSRIIKNLESAGYTV
ncbi:MAG: phosphoribosylaminoimidazolesuccinocarboxamide synthase [Candidatus Marinimicrobia bacterium]|jgi:phosphoribosylaminoimidazole-succinocarboxamide synthase|nr:phosphoribosylaminoimidazolesuccinocarboxamide synthase [Candidatus Neomarinimicrobiota bacterium]MBT5956759.1 phosphoribosylaminoimidazolesuccinocarboxamide synthase [Candidatus Neomarinimicrobiota bacterium]MBT6870394.1 phosphoribosylaminoimidazolesuccinocarboxamide synthase [Candidatus Neomarinimicrobiota bacterium]MBT7377290.1 phosphoribosylaminoimidazolesuccinocarboxamide synthase [Candidatus Neomarinimicrobiota bacterium]|tara:strand:- start:2895 stop:3842 length:948 start_codon:yes stop_codon:yes gene_type:complete